MWELKRDADALERQVTRMNYKEFTEQMKREPFTDALEYRLGYGAMTSRGNEWPQIVNRVEDSAVVVKVPLYHLRGDKYVHVLGFMPDAFRGKEKITDIVIGRVKDCVIEAGSFAGCRNLKRITMPKLIRIEKEAFKDCDSLEDVYFDGSPEEWKEIKIVSEKHEVDFGEFIPGTPVSKVEDERLVHIPGNEALFKATIHFNCDPDEILLDGIYKKIHELIYEKPGKMSVALAQLQ